MSDLKILPLESIQAKHFDRVGGKAKGLSQLIRGGFNVPRGFVLTTNFSRVDDPLLKSYLKDLSGSSFAVRSSATIEDGESKSFAGQFDTYLNVKAEEVYSRVINCWDSIKNIRSVSYDKSHNGEMAVVVQEMIEGEVSGVGFSINPITKKLDEIIVEAVAGLGEKLVGGEITPTTYHLNSGDFSVHQVLNANEELVSLEDIKEIGRGIKQIEDCLGFPVDVEWTMKDGEIYWLQARPITSVDENTIPDTSIDWKHYLTRPFSLFGATLWQAWYDSQQIKEMLDVELSSVLFLEQHVGVVRCYRDSEELSGLLSTIESLIKDEPKKLIGIFQRGLKLNDLAADYISTNERDLTLEASINFMIDLALHSTVLPNLGLILMEKLQIEDKHMIKLAEELRAVSYYPKFIDSVIVPAAQKRLCDLGIENASEIIHFFTLQELLAGNMIEARARLELSKKGQRLAYQLKQNQEYVQYVGNIDAVIQSLEDIPVFDFSDEDKRHLLKGMGAFHGRVKGQARVVLNDNFNGVFHQGDILVSIHSTPTLMPFIKKCGGIVTDEGGVSCHAAIVSRELKKPCVMSTKYATSVIKDGDILEIDAFKGLVRIIRD